MSDKTMPGAERVKQALADRGLEFKVVELGRSTRTAPEAARAVGCDLAQICKSLVFRAVDSDRPVLVLTSGANRVDEAKLVALLGERIGKADAEFVRARTGYAIGGVAPLGHAEDMAVFIDRDLMDLEVIWAAAGTPRSVFSLTPSQLLEVTRGRVVKVA